MNVGDTLPALGFDWPDGTRGNLSAFAGKALVIYFYPKDDTPGCTNEAKAFSEQIDAFAALGVAVLGVSKDTPASHAKFQKKYDLKVSLASDGDGSVCEAMGVWVEKSMYGKSYMGIERATFLIDATGVVVQIWRKVKVAGHVESVLVAIRQQAG